MTGAVSFGFYGSCLYGRKIYGGHRDQNYGQVLTQFRIIVIVNVKNDDNGLF